MMGAQQESDGDILVGLSVALLGVWLSVPTCHLQSALGSTSGVADWLLRFQWRFHSSRLIGGATLVHLV